MDGQHQNNNEKTIKYLASWINEIIQTKGWMRYDHLHIDDIDKKFKNPKKWLEKSLFLYDCLEKLLDKSIFNSFLCIPLSYSDTAIKLEKINFSYIKDKIETNEPPSLYLYPLGDFNHNQIINESVLIENLSVELQKHVYLNEIKYDDGYMRTIFIKT